MAVGYKEGRLTMCKITKKIQPFVDNETGATLVEYGVALLLAVIVGGVTLSALANQTNSNLETACDTLTPASAVSAGLVDRC